MKPSHRIAQVTGESIFDNVYQFIGDKVPKNLGSGVTEWDTPQKLKELLYQSTLAAENQYGRSPGQPILVNAIAKQYSARMGREIDPLTEIVVCHGATGALTNACCAFLEEGDEVITLEPSFESYFVQPPVFGGKIVPFELDLPREGSDKWTVDFEKLEKTFNEKTRFLILNTPHNPTGKVFTKEELEKIGEIVKKWPRALVVCEEVYEYVCYDGYKHVSIATLEGMWNKTLTISTASKTFSCAGWRVGWIIAASELIEPLFTSQNWLNLGANRPAQVAVGGFMDTVANQPYNGEENYYAWFNKTCQKKKDSLYKSLSDNWMGIKVFNPEGGFFILADITKAIPLIPLKYYFKAENDKASQEGVDKEELIAKHSDYSSDYAMVRWFIDEFNVLCIPCFPFYDQKGLGPSEYKGKNLVRFALCRNDDTLDAVGDILRKKLEKDGI